MRVVDPSLKARPDEPDRQERAQAAVASIYSAHLAGFHRREIADHFGLTWVQVERVIASIPPPIRAMIERSADDPDGEVARWRKERADADEWMIQTSLRMALVVESVLTEWRASPDALDVAPLAERLYRRRLDGLDYDQLAAEFGISRARVARNISGLSDRRRHAIERGARTASR